MNSQSNVTFPSHCLLSPVPSFHLLESLLNMLGQIGVSPARQTLAIVIGTFILEDAASAATGVLVGDGQLSVRVELGALYAGIAVGDLWLYGMGRLARQAGLIRARLDLERLRGISAILRKRLVYAVVASRFVPGLRLPTYTACGLFAVPFARFAVIVLGAAMLWTGLLFAVTWAFGALVLDHLGALRWPVALAAIIGAMVAVRRLGTRAHPRPSP